MGGWRHPAASSSSTVLVVCSSVGPVVGLSTYIHSWRVYFSLPFWFGEVYIRQNKATRGRILSRDFEQQRPEQKGTCSSKRYI